MINTINYVLGFCFNEDRSQLALIEKLKPEWQKGFYNGIGGKVEAEEAVYAAMVREFKEETGLLVKEWRKYCIMEGPCNRDADNWRVHVFYAVVTDAAFYRIGSAEKEKVTKWPIASLPGVKKLYNLSWLIPLALENINGLYYSIDAL